MDSHKVNQRCFFTNHIVLEFHVIKQKSITYDSSTHGNSVQQDFMTEVIMIHANKLPFFCVYLYLL